MIYGECFRTSNSQISSKSFLSASKMEQSFSCMFYISQYIGKIYHYLKEWCQNGINDIEFRKFKIKGTL